MEGERETRQRKVLDIQNSVDQLDQIENRYH